MDKIQDLQQQFPVTKTLRFDLKPVGKTLECIEKNGIISRDEQRAADVVVVKSSINKYINQFNQSVLYNNQFKVFSDGKKDSLEEFYYYLGIPKRTKSEDDCLNEVKENLRKQVSKWFKKDDTYGKIFGKEETSRKKFINDELLNFVTDEIEKEIIRSFDGFTTYFKGFLDIREYIYSSDDKENTIPYRLVNENLQRHGDNMKSFEKISSTAVADNFKELEDNLGDMFSSVESLKDVYQIGYISTVLTQKQIIAYNAIISGKTLEDGTKVKGLNEYVNQYNQKQKNKKDKLPLLKTLNKMILSDTDSVSWRLDKFTSDEEMLEELVKKLNSIDGALENCKRVLTHLNDYDTSHIFITKDNKYGFTDISYKLYGDHSIYTDAKKDELRQDISKQPRYKRKSEDAIEKRVETEYKEIKSFSIDELNRLADDEGAIQSYFAQLGAYDRNGKQELDIFTKIEMNRIAAADILAGEHTDIYKLSDDIIKIKDLLDAYKKLQHFIRPLIGGDESDKDCEFDTIIRMIYDELKTINHLYDKVRNWLTRKVYSDEKIKLNFDNSQLLNGFDLNKETANCGILLLKDGKYYLAIMDKSSNNAFKNELPDDGDCYEKIDYKQIPFSTGLGGFVRKCGGTAEQYGWKCPGNCKNKEGKIIITDAEAEPVLPELIDCYKDFLNKYQKDGYSYSNYNFKFKDSKDYDKLSSFFADVKSQRYKISFRMVSVSFIDSLVNQGKLYLFQIWSKDFSEYSKGTPNMHTLYLKMLFDERNLADAIYKLNGESEIFFRKKSLALEDTTIHPAHHAIVNKNKQNKKKVSVFDYDIIKNRRYTVDKFLLHISVTLNFKADEKGNVDNNVLEIIRNKGIKHIIGIDRGERNLLYVSIIDFDGNIVLQKSLDDIMTEYKGNTYVTKYNEKLKEIEHNRAEARRNWQTIDSINDLKEGYLSQAIPIIIKMMIEYQAVVALEDLNYEFMHNRQPIERNIYKKFEDALISKLNYYVDKHADVNEPCGLLHALQLTNRQSKYNSHKKQNGCIFYIPASYTSNIDPVTGFINMLNTKYKNIESTRLFFSKFDSIRYNALKGYFEFSFDYANFTTKTGNTRTKWTVCSYGTRICAFKNELNKWDNKEVDITEEFKKVLTGAGIDINGNLKAAICSLTDKTVLERLLRLMRLMLQMRNSVINTDIDYILSPVADENGEFFDSRKCSDNLPVDADANGAYNIARKGLWNVLKIMRSDESKTTLNRDEWLQFAQQKPYLNN